MDVVTKARMAFSGVNNTIDLGTEDATGQIRSFISDMLSGWTNLQLFVAFMLVCITYDQGRESCPCLDVYS
jgi:hypothetical protein